MFDEDGRCTCTECRLKFHTEMAAWAREQLTQQEEPAPCVSQNHKTKDANGPSRKRKTAKSNGKETKGKDQGKDKGKDKGNAYPRGFMPWNDVIKTVAANTSMDFTTTEQILGAVNEAAGAEICAGRA